MININTGQNVVDAAMQIIDKKLQQQRRGIVVREKGSPPRPPAYVQRRRRLLKSKPKQMRKAKTMTTNAKRIEREGGIYGDQQFLIDVIDERKLITLPDTPKDPNGWGRVRGAAYPNLIKIPSPYSSHRADYDLLKDANVRAHGALDEALADLVEYVEQELEGKGFEIVFTDER